MKDLFEFIFLLLISINLSHHDRAIKERIDALPYEQHDTIYVCAYPTEWSALLDAIVETESNGNPDAFNERTNAAGILQITPIYVAEVNRLSGRNYTLEDRFDIEKSVEMYHIYQSHKNPERDLDKAIWLHNPTASDKYRNKVLSNM